MSNFFSILQPPIPHSDNVDPLSILTDDAEIAMWNNYSLPSDRMSSENAAILTNSQRWPLMIDPQVNNNKELLNQSSANLIRYDIIKQTYFLAQLQGVKWIKSMHSSNLKVIRLGSKGYLDSIEEVQITYFNKVTYLYLRMFRLN